MKTDYLPAWATLAETTAWLEARTGEPWPLARVIESGLMPWVWLAPDPSGGPQDPLMVHVFEGRGEGYLAPMVFAGDTYRLAVARDCVLSMTRTPSGRVFKINPPPTIPIEELRFKAEQIRAMAERLAEPQQVTSEPPAREVRAAGDWVPMAQEIAREHIASIKGRWYPSQKLIAEHVAEELLKREVRSVTGTPLSAGYIARYALKGITSGTSMRRSIARNHDK